MAKKQTRRSISVSRMTYERLKAFCEANNVSMSQFVETRVGDFLGEGEARPTVTVTDVVRPIAPRPMTPAPRATSIATVAAASAGPAAANSSVASSAPVAARSELRSAAPAVAAPTHTVPMTSAAARFAVEPPPPVIKQKQQEAAPKPAEKRPDQIFTF